MYVHMYINKITMYVHVIQVCYFQKWMKTKAVSFAIPPVSYDIAIMQEDFAMIIDKVIIKVNSYS